MLRFSLKSLTSLTTCRQTRGYRSLLFYESYHLSGDETGRIATWAPTLLDTRHLQPTGDLIDTTSPNMIRLKPREEHPGKVEMLQLVEERHTVLPLSANTSSLLPPSVASTVIHINMYAQDMGIPEEDIHQLRNRKRKIYPRVVWPRDSLIWYVAIHPV